MGWALRQQGDYSAALVGMVGGTIWNTGGALLGGLNGFEGKWDLLVDLTLLVGVAGESATRYITDLSVCGW